MTVGMQEKTDGGKKPCAGLFCEFGDYFVDRIDWSKDFKKVYLNI
jgi:hypothetical protein